MKLLLWLYPGDWRRRYGPELLALLEQGGLGPRDLFDLLRGALDAWTYQAEWRQTMRRKQTDETCSFCGGAKSKRAHLIRGPGGVFICDECVELCNRIIAESPSGGGEAEHSAGARRDRASGGWRRLLHRHEAPLTIG